MLLTKELLLKNLNNCKNNLQQPFGFSADMKNSIAKAKRFVKKSLVKNIEFRSERIMKLKGETAGFKEYKFLRG